MTSNFDHTGGALHVCMVVFGDLPYDFRVFREASALSEAGHKVTVIASDFATAPMPAVWSTFDLQLLAVDRSRSLRRSYPDFWRRAARSALATPADVYHAHDLDGLWPAAKAARRRQVPLVYDSHELFTQQSSLVHRPTVRRFWTWWEQRLLAHVDRTITVSDGIADRLQQQYRLSQKPTVIRNLPPWREPVQDQRLRTALGWLNDPLPIALYQGGFLTDNGLAEVIEAMRFVDAGRLVLLGGGPLEASLQQQVRSSGLQERVRFLPRVPFPDLHAWTCGADVGVCVIKPTGDSFAMSLPNKLFEYFIAGLPVVAGDTAQIRPVVRDAGAGIVADAGDPAAIGNALQSLLADTTERQRMGAAARTAARHYNWQAEAPRLLELYGSL